MTRPPVALALLLLVAAPLARADEAEGARSTTTPELHTVQLGPLTTGCQRDGVVHADEAVRVTLRLEGEPGRLEVARVGTALLCGGAVVRGDALLVVRAVDLPKALRSARETVETARLDLAHLEVEQRLAVGAAAQELEQADATSRDAARARERFTSLEAASDLEDSALDEEQSVNSLADQKDELDQLEKLYRGTQLAPETKEIVLERARRDARTAERRLAVTKTNRIIRDQWSHPDRQRALDEAARWAADGLKRAREGEPLAAARRAEALEAARRAVRDAEERLEELQGDEGRLVVVAPADGVVAPADLHPGDALSAGQVLTTLHDPTRLVVEVAATEDDLRYLAPGKAVQVRLPAYAEVELPGEVRDLAALGAPGADGAPTFRCVVRLGDADPLLRIGVRARIEAEGAVVKRALTVPRKAVTEKDGRTFVRVWTGEAAQELEVVLGPGNRQWVQVVHGLVSGDRVVVGQGQGE